MGIWSEMDMTTNNTPDETRDIELFYEHYQRVISLIRDGYFLKDEYIDSLWYARQCMEEFANAEWGIRKPWENVH